VKSTTQFTKTFSIELGEYGFRANPIPGRGQHRAFALNNELCIAAGSDATGRKNDVWCSPSGSNWRVAYSAPLQCP
jgi:hypothetical protein